MKEKETKPADVTNPDSNAQLNQDEIAGLRGLLTGFVTRLPAGNSPTPAHDLKALENRVTAAVVKRLRKNTPAANPVEFSPEAIERLHDLYEETGDARLGEVLDEVCDDPDCHDCEEAADDK